MILAVWTLFYTWDSYEEKFSTVYLQHNILSIPVHCVCILWNFLNLSLSFEWCSNSSGLNKEKGWTQQENRMACLRAFVFHCAYSFLPIPENTSLVYFCASCVILGEVLFMFSVIEPSSYSFRTDTCNGMSCIQYTVCNGMSCIQYTICNGTSCIKYTICNGMSCIQYTICDGMSCTQYIICNGMSCIQYIIYNGMSCIQYIICSGMSCIQYIVCNGMFCIQYTICKGMSCIQYTIQYTICNGKSGIQYTLPPVKSVKNVAIWFFFSCTTVCFCAFSVYFHTHSDKLFISVASVQCPLSNNGYLVERKVCQVPEYFTWCVCTVLSAGVWDLVAGAIYWYSNSNSKQPIELGDS